MTDPAVPPDEFDRLLSTLCDTGLTAESRAALNRLLRSDRALRRRYLIYLGVHATLGHLIGGEVPTGAGECGGSARSCGDGGAPPCESCEAAAPSPSPAPALASRGRRRPRLAMAATVLLLAGAAGSAAWWWPRRPAGTVPSPPPSPSALAPGPVVARVSASAGARFEGSGPTAAADGPLRAGPYRLVEGIVRLTFAHEAEVIITAPAEFLLQSEGRLFLVRGKLTANVPAPAKGFTVETPSATLVDLGTEFAADVDGDGNGEVHVFRGEVIVQPRSQTDSRPLRLVESQATRVDAVSGTPSGIEADPGRFLRGLEEPLSPYSRLVRDLGPAAYLPMEPAADGGSLVDACARAAPAA